jgi:hypothetical protein
VEDPQYPSLESCRSVLANLSVGNHSARANSSPVHVIFSHYLPGFLDPVLQSVLNWMVTHDAVGKDVEGRPSNRRRFSATQIAGGYSVEGRRVSWGCGCNRGTVIRAMNTLEDYHIIRRIGDARSAKKGANGEYGCLYELELNYSAWDWEKMRARREENDSSNRSRSEKARQALEEKRAANPSGAKIAPLKQSKRSVSQTDNSKIGLSGNPSAVIHSAPQSDPEYFISLSVIPIVDHSVAQSDPHSLNSLSHNPNPSDGIAPQSETPSPLIKESINKEIRNMDVVQTLVDHFLWAFTPHPKKKIDFELTNGQVKELSEWVEAYGEEGVRDMITTVSRLPKPPAIERAFGLLRHYLKKGISAGRRSKTDPVDKDTSTDFQSSSGWENVAGIEIRVAEEEIPGQDWEKMLERATPEDSSAMDLLRSEMRRLMDKANYNDWFVSCRLMGRDDEGRIVIGMINKFYCEWANDRLKQTVERIFTGALAQTTGVIFMVFSAKALSNGF